MGIKFTYTGDEDTAHEDIPLFASADDAVKDIHLESEETFVKINITEKTKKED